MHDSMHYSLISNKIWQIFMCDIVQIVSQGTLIRPIQYIEIEVVYETIRHNIAH